MYYWCFGGLGFGLGQGESCLAELQEGLACEQHVLVTDQTVLADSYY